MANKLLSLIHKLVFKIRWILLSDKARSNYIVSQIRKGGGIVGENVDIIDCLIDPFEPRYLISIGNNVTMKSVRVLTHDASIKKILGYTMFGTVVIGNDVFVGAHSILLPGCKIGNRVIIGAGSVVTGEVPDNSVACGAPCKPICSFDEYIEKMKNKMADSPCYDLYPPELIKEVNRDKLASLKDHGYGFMR